MSESLLTKIRGHQPRAFKMGNGALFCRLRELPPELGDEVRAYNDRILPRKAAPVVRTATPARSTAPRPKSPRRIALEKLWQACLDRGGPSLADADALAAEIGPAKATALVRAHGAEAPLAALTERAWRSWGKGAEA